MYAENIATREKIEQFPYWSQSPFVQTENRFSTDALIRFLPSVCSNHVSHVRINNDKLDKLNIAWQKEYNEYSHYIKENQKKFKSNVEKLNQIVAQIHFEDYEIELTPNNSVKYTFLLPDKKILMITKSFNSYEDKAEEDVVFSIFENRKHILSDIKNLDELVTGINRYMGM